MLFVDECSDWWPLSSHHIGERFATRAIIEAHEGGRWYGRDEARAECDWGRGQALAHPARLAALTKVGGPRVTSMQGARVSLEPVGPEHVEPLRERRASPEVERWWEPAGEGWPLSAEGPPASPSPVRRSLAWVER